MTGDYNEYQLFYFASPIVSHRKPASQPQYGVVVAHSLALSVWEVDGLGVQPSTAHLFNMKGRRLGREPYCVALPRQGANYECYVRRVVMLTGLGGGTLSHTVFSHACSSPWWGRAVL